MYCNKTSKQIFHRKQEKMLVTIIFSLYHNVFDEKLRYLRIIKTVICKLKLIFILN